MKYPEKITYPRRTIIRKVLKFLAKVFVYLLADIKINGLENFPKKGPYIVIGNHVSSFEPILMLVLTPHQMEFLGSGDIPIDPRMSVFTNLYQFIPVMRGQIDQKGLNLALNVLENGGVLGIFPEGGIWDKNLKEPKLGTSWLSYKSKVNIVPIGFVGMNQALKNALTLKRPKVSVTIGKLISYEELFLIDGTLKDKMGYGAQKIISRIAELLPQEEIINPTNHVKKEITIKLIDELEKEKKDIVFRNIESFVSLIEHPVIMDVFKRNLKLRVDCLFLRNKKISINDILISLDEIIDYLEINPGFLSYRFGIEEALRMKDGLENLTRFLQNLKNNNDYIIIKSKLLT